MKRKYLGIRYHKDSDISDRYCIMTYGDSIKETKEKLQSLETPGYTEEYKFFEYGVDASLTLHQALLNDSLDCSYNHLYKCEDDINDILNLKFRVTRYLDFKI